MKNFIILMLLSLSTSVFAQIDTISSIEQEMINQINTLRTNPKSYIPYVQEYIAEQMLIIKAQELAIKSYENITTINTTPTSTTTITYKYRNVETNTKLRKFLIGKSIANIKIANDLILILNTTPPVPILKLDTIMYSASKQHLITLTNENKFCHECASDGTLEKRMKHRYLSFGENLAPNEGVIKSLVILLLDNGTPNFGHRKTLLSIGPNRKWSFISVAINDKIIVQNFAH